MTTPTRLTAMLCGIGLIAAAATPALAQKGLDEPFQGAFKESLRGKTVAWIGDSNNVCNTWLQAAEAFDFNVHVSTPPGYEVEPERAGLYGTDHYEEFEDPMKAAKGADLITTDVWTSMGDEAQSAKRRKDFEAWRVDVEMMKAAKKDALFMHCLPAHRGEEVAAGVIDGPQSVVWEEAENRLHAQKALLEFLLLGTIKAPMTPVPARGKTAGSRTRSKGKGRTGR